MHACAGQAILTVYKTERLALNEALLWTNVSITVNLYNYPIKHAHNEHNETSWLLPMFNLKKSLHLAAVLENIENAVT